MKNKENFIIGFISVILFLFWVLAGFKLFGAEPEVAEYIFDLDDIGCITLKDIHQQHPHLTKLDIAGTQQHDISDIRLFTKLTWLDISINPYMKDISPLSALTNLRSLRAVRNTHIKDWGVLTTLQNLEELTLTQDPDVDLSFTQHLNKLTKLEVLHISQMYSHHPTK